MKKIFLLATVALLVGSSVVLANGDDKNKQKNDKAKTEKTCDKSCKKSCTKSCSKSCDKSKCKKG